MSERLKAIVDEMRIRPTDNVLEIGCGHGVAASLVCEHLRTGRLVAIDKSKTMIAAYNAAQDSNDQEICDLLAKELDRGLPHAESKLWHGHPVWFLDGNPIVGYSKQKPGIRLMFWSGADFDEPGLAVVGKKFKDASVFYRNVAEIEKKDLQRWLTKSREIQWDYKNIVKRKGRLVKRPTSIEN
jgi:SAM-dependent methyltransferase